MKLREALKILREEGVDCVKHKQNGITTQLSKTEPGYWVTWNEVTVWLPMDGWSVVNKRPPKTLIETLSDQIDACREDIRLILDRLEKLSEAD